MKNCERTLERFISGGRLGRWKASRHAAHCPDSPKHSPIIAESPPRLSKPPKSIPRGALSGRARRRTIFRTSSRFQERDSRQRFESPPLSFLAFRRF